MNILLGRRGAQKSESNDSTQRLALCGHGDSSVNGISPSSNGAVVASIFSPHHDEERK